MRTPPAPPCCLSAPLILPNHSYGPRLSACMKTAASGSMGMTSLQLNAPQCRDRLCCIGKSIRRTAERAMPKRLAAEYVCSQKALFLLSLLGVNDIASVMTSTTYCDLLIPCVVRKLSDRQYFCQ
eukprot:5382-Eustigmatos_ZCMA.PRE.1